MCALDEEADREAKRNELLDQIHKAVPTASVDVRWPSGNGTIILSGNVPRRKACNVIHRNWPRASLALTANIVNNAMRIGAASSR